MRLFLTHSPERRLVYVKCSLNKMHLVVGDSFNSDEYLDDWLEEGGLDSNRSHLDCGPSCTTKLMRQP